VIIEDIARDEDEIHSESPGSIAQLLERSESSLSNPIAGILLEPRHSQAKVEVRDVQETDHQAAFLGDDLSPMECVETARPIRDLSRTVAYEVRRAWLGWSFAAVAAPSPTALPQVPVVAPWQRTD
jgi:hypothetical protein